MIAANHAKASMTLAVIRDPSMTVRPIKLTLSLTGSHTFFSFSFIMAGGHAPINEGKSENVLLPVKLSVSLTSLTVMLGSSMTTKIMLALA